MNNKIEMVYVRIKDSPLTGIIRGCATWTEYNGEECKGFIVELDKGMWCKDNTNTYIRLMVVAECNVVEIPLPVKVTDIA
jgi:hypothetical protein